MQLLSSHVENARAKSSDDGRTLLLSKLGLTFLSSNALAELERAERLALSNNALHDLPHDFSRLTHLRYLNLRGNRLTTVPDILTSLPALDTLDVSHNKITKFPADPENLINLKTLILTKNLLTTLPSYISKFNRLRNLHVDRNPLEWPPKAVIDVPSKKDSDEGMADWVRSLQLWMEADVAQNGIYSNRQDDSGYGSSDAKDLESSIEDSLSSWSRFGASIISRRSSLSHRRGSSASSGTSLPFGRAASNASTSDFGYDSSPAGSSRGALPGPHSRNYSIDSSFSIDSIAESEFEDADQDFDISITSNDSEYLELGYTANPSSRKRNGGLHRHEPSYASSLSQEPTEMHKEDPALAPPSLHLGILQTYSTENSPIRSLFERDGRESYLPSPAHSEDQRFFDHDTDSSSGVARESYRSGLTDSSSTSTLTAASKDLHQRNRSYASSRDVSDRYSRQRELGKGYVPYGSNGMAKKSMPDLRTAQLNFTKKNTPQDREGSVPPTLQNASNSTLNARRRERKAMQPSVHGAEDDTGMPSPLSARQDSGSSHGTSAGGSSQRSFSGGIRPLFAGTGRTFDSTSVSPTRPPPNSTSNFAVPPSTVSHTVPPQGSTTLHHTPSMASERNSYFRRLSTLPGHSRTLPPPLLVLVDSARSILFALSQIYQGLEVFVFNEATTPSSSGDPFGPTADDGVDRVALILRKVLTPASLDLNALINSLSQFDDVWAKRTVPSPTYCRSLVESCRDAVTAFGKVVNVLALQLPILFASSEHQQGKNGAEDARFERALLLMLYGAMAEIAGAWGRLHPVNEELLPLIQAAREPTKVSNSFENYSLSSSRSAATSGRAPPSSRSTPRPSLTHVARRNAGSFSIQDVELGKTMPDEAPRHPSVMSPPVNKPSQPTLRGQRRPSTTSPSVFGPSPASSGSYSFTVGPPSSPWPSASSDLSKSGMLDYEIGRPSISHSREGSQASLHTNSSSSSPLIPSRGPALLDPASALTKSSSTVDKSALFCVREVLDVAAAVWDGLEDVLLNNSDNQDAREVKENLATGREITRRLAEIVSPAASENSLQGLGDDARALLKTIVNLSNAYKARFASYTPDDSLRSKLLQLSTSAGDLAIFLRVASFSTSPSRGHSPMPSGASSPGITTTIAPPTPSPSGSIHPTSPAPRSSDEASRPRLPDAPVRTGLSRSRSAQAQASAKVVGVSLDDMPRSALPTQSFGLPPSPVLQTQRRRELTVNVGDPG